MNQQMKTKISVDTNKDVSVLEIYRQVISSDLMEALKESAMKHGVSIDVEVAMRLMAYLSQPELSGENSLSQQILNLEFTHEEAIEECKRKREATLFVYEMEKLRLFMRFEQKLPRNIKESFLKINVKEAMEIIKRELALEKAKDTE